MFAPVGNDPKAEYSNELSAADLLIFEFDQWTYTDHPRIEGCGLCTGCHTFEPTL